ncbi:MAG: hypothetical protein AB8C46_16710 [Burkholderiaceae bacterium]
MNQNTSLQLYDSIGYLVQPQIHIDAAVIVTGSHAGDSAARFVLEHGERPLAVFFNDAGIGKDSAGISGLSLLQTHDIAAVAYSFESARIGEARDGLDNGITTHLNVAAAGLNLWIGQPVALAVQQLLKRRTHRL